MIHAFAAKTVSVIKPASIATNATSTGNIDRLGYDYVEIDVTLDSQASTTSKPAVLKLAESDTTDTTNFSDISVGGTSATNFTVPGAGSAATIFKWGVDCRARKRYLKVSLTPGDAAQIASVNASLYRGGEAPNTLAKRGLSGFVNP